MESTFNTLYSADIQRNNTGGGGTYFASYGYYEKLILQSLKL